MLINDILARINANKEAINSAISRVIDSGWLILGPEVKNFEFSFAEYLGASHCVGLANGTDAIELTLRAIGLERGDSVATVANAGMYTTTAMLAIGVTPFFLDVDIESCNMTLSEVERAIAAGVKAVVVTHLYGLATPQIREIAKCCAQNGVWLLEDCAQAHGALVDGKRIGTFGDASCFSFYPTKNLGGLGDGGAMVTNSDEIAQKVSCLRQYGWSFKYQVEFSGARNSRLDEMQAAILHAFLPDLDRVNALRRQIAMSYNSKIKHADVDLPMHSGLDYVGHLYVLRSEHRDSLRAYLQTLDIASEVHYPIPDYRQPVFDEKFSNLRLENTERLAHEVLTLPCYPEMTDVQVDRVIAGVNSWRP